MKKSLSLLVVLFVFSCKTEIEPQESLKAFDKSSLSETSQLFVPLAEVAWDFMKDENSRNIVYSEIEKQFDGDYNVLFTKMLKEESSSLGRLVKAETIQKAEIALEVFKTVDKTGSVYPQIYIPFYEELEAEGKLGIQDPVVVFRDGPPAENGAYQGYSFENKQLMDKGMISEEFASKNEVWVISINERVNSNGEVKENILSSNSSGRLKATSPQINGVTIYGKSNLKEDWISGAAEVSLSNRILYNGSNTTDIAYFTDNELREAQIDAVVDVSRKNAKKSNFVTANSRYFMKNWDTDPNYVGKNYAVYILFEYDPWPAGVHTNSYNGISTGYRSYESPWYTGQVYLGNSAGYSYNGNGIYFKLY